MCCCPCWGSSSGTCSAGRRAPPISRRFRLAADIGLAVSGLGLAPLGKKAALTAGAGPLTLAIATTLVAALLAAVVLLVRHGTASLGRLGAGTYRHVAVVGVLGSGAVVLLSILAMTDTTATNRSLFQSMYPVATAIAARLLLGERLGRLAWLTVILMSFGLFLMNTGEAGLVIGRSFWLLAATLPLIGLSDVYARRTLRDADPAFVTCGRLIFGTLVLLLVLPLTDSAGWQRLLPLSPWVILAGIAMAAGALGLYRAMQTAGASLAAAFAGLAPVVTVTAEWLVLGASFSKLQLAGLVFVTGGAAVLASRLREAAAAR